ncbi:MAG: DUF3237 family protein, partial [Verrucomicrobiaceae bacterium]
MGDYMAVQIPVEHMFTLRLEGLADNPYQFDGPFGRRAFERATAGTATGNAVQGTVLDLLASDYGRASSDGRLQSYNGSLAIQADDGTVILLHYRGRRSPRYAEGTSRYQILFQAPEGKYGWFNGVQAIGYGDHLDDCTVIEIYALTGKAEREGEADMAPPAQRRTVPADLIFSRRSQHTPGATRHIIPAPLGTRYLTLAEGGGTLQGPRIKGEWVSGYSWSPHRILQRADGEIPLWHFDLDVLLKTDDGVPILMSYTGVSSERYEP